LENDLEKKERAYLLSAGPVAEAQFRGLASASLFPLARPSNGPNRGPKPSSAGAPSPLPLLTDA